jgi:beta-1,4-mannosyl-glycoprotein beta-1,4-N-acetylglucosaminyltransferase
MSHTIDCFTFFNELDILELRFEEMSRAVDFFVLAESPITFQGHPKPLFYAENRKRFERFSSRIRHIVVDDMPMGLDPWARERHQRNALKRALSDVDTTATVLISDVDEIVRPEAIAEARRRRTFCYFSLDHFCYYVNWRRRRMWTKPYAAPYLILSKLEDFSLPRQEPLVYLHNIGANAAESIIDHAGWHFSWTGGPSQIVTKLNSYSHTEPPWSQLKDQSSLRSAIDNEICFYSGEPLENLCISRGFPQNLQVQEAKYRGLSLISPNSSDGRPYYDQSLIIVEEQRNHIAALQSELDAIHRSKSWRFTRPARSLRNVLKRIFYK